MNKLTLIFALILLQFSLFAQVSKGKCEKGDCENGFGIFVFAGGDKYEGEWKDGKMEGMGTYTSKSGNIYKGQYKDNLRHGYGTYQWPEGDVYIGEYAKNLRTGLGTYTDAEGNREEGIYEDGKLIKSIRKQAAGEAEVKNTTPIPAPEPVKVTVSSPKIAFLSPAKAEATTHSLYTFRACVETDSEVKEVQVYLNNGEVVATRGFSVDEEGECKHVVSQTIQLQPGENVITLKVITDKGGKAMKNAEAVTFSEPVAQGINFENHENRTALIIGNSDYEKSPLKNSINDAVAMAKSLEELGFAVTLLTNADARQMKDAFREFGADLKVKGGVGMFYYSGHGLQAGGSNYLLPLKADIRKEEDIEYETVDIGRMVVEMEFAQNPMNIIILDACRDNPYATSFRGTAGGNNGLKGIDRVPTGTFIAYSTAPGSVASDGVGENGLYTQELLKAIKQPNVKIEDIFKQVRASVRKLSGGTQIPWENSSIEGDFYFIKK